MKGGVLIGFLPLVVYGILAGNSVSSVTLALAVVIFLSCIIGWNDLRKRILMAWLNVALFGSALIAIGVLDMAWVIPYMGTLIYATLAVFAFSSILIGMPFTMQYAREMVDQKHWEDPRFIRVNILISGVWGGVFLTNLCLSASSVLISGFIGHVGQMLTYAVLVFGVFFTVWYPGHIQKMANHRNDGSLTG